MLKVKKRNGKLINWEKGRIKKAVKLAMSETEKGIDEDIATDIENRVHNFFENQELEYVKLEDLEEKVISELMEDRKEAAEKYIVYKYVQSTLPPKKEENKIWTQHKHDLTPMDNLGTFVFYRTYSKYLKGLERRERWWETTARAVRYNTNLDPTLPDEEKSEVLDLVFNNKLFLSGRTLWMGGGEIADTYPMANFNCAFEVIDSLEAFKDLFYLLMIGSGVGVRVLKKDVDKIPELRSNILVVHEDYAPVPVEERLDITSLISLDNSTIKIIVGDSKEGWVTAIEHYLAIMSSIDYNSVERVIINYDNVRPKGEKLKRFGGTASGHIPLRRMFRKIKEVVDRKSINDKTKLKPIDCLDIANIIGENVVSGGVRRTAEIVLIDPDDKECIEAKSKLYVKKDGKFVQNKEISHRTVSNNSIMYQSKPTREKLNWQIDQMKTSGEPAFINAEAAKKRKPTFKGTNPCGEILLEDKGLCNLTSVNVMGFVENSKLNEEKLYNAQKHSVKSAIRLTLVDLERPKWDRTHKSDKIVGCSLTGWQDMVNAAGLDKDQEIEILKNLREVAHDEAEKYCNTLGIKKPDLVTTVKPEGTQSQMPGVSSGLHYSHSPYFVRRVRINADDPLCKVMEDLEYPIFPEVGQTKEDCTTKVVEFPVKAPEGKTKYDVSAIEQLETYKMFMEHYVDHNASITVHVRNNEWDDVKEWMWDNWDDVVGVTFLSLNDSNYPLLPYESIDKKEYEERMEKMKNFRPSLINKYENEDGKSSLEGSKSCESGVCPIR
ncbi:MAG: ribonucleoside-triphosphate reductase, adenosylcobalamin-dependent [Fusobacteriota bacterium]